MKPLFELQLERPSKGARDGAAMVYRQLRAAILDGRLVAGSRLPPSRQANGHFGISRNTAVEVYDRLLQEGLAVARQGSGTFVAHVALEISESARPPLGSDVDARLNPFWLNEHVGRWTGYWQLPEDAPVIAERLIDLRPALVDPRHFPFDRLRQSLTLKLRDMERKPARNGAPWGNRAITGCAPRSPSISP